jgi:hypothetical protein
VSEPVAPITSWRPARKFPETYPGDCPDSHFLILDGEVHRLEDADGRGGYRLRTGNRAELDRLLAERELSPLAERYPVLAYGGNRNPATLVEKLANYGYRPPAGTGVCLPVLAARLRDADVVACALHGHGYLYGELLLDGRFARGTTLDVRVCLVDVDQLRVLNESEGLGAGLYRLARIPEVSIRGCARTVSPLAYVAGARAWLSPVYGAPMGYSLLSATGRVIPPLTATEQLAHVIDTLGLAAEIGAYSGLKNDDALPAELAKYLNGQWWYHFHTGQPPVIGYSTILDLVNQALAKSTVDLRTADYLDELGYSLPAAAAYAPGPRYAWANC